MTHTDDMIRHLRDESAIRDTLARAALTSSNGDTAGFRDLFTSDAVWVLGEPNPQRAEGPDAITALFDSLWQGNDYFMQITVPGTIEVHGDRAAAVSPCQEFATGPNGRFYRNVGVWTDQLRRSGDRWLLTERSFEIRWLDLSPFSGDSFPFTPRG